ncbi:MAG: hypothetical protein JXR56_04290 [Candidatus Cloacimonetes bacterium]|nr:hypothetical protein [Candidatus Cloacimonadota bacterium]
MKISNGTKKLDDYSDMIKHIINVSEIVKISCEGNDSYCFTITLENHNCVNVVREVTQSNDTKIYEEINHYRESILSDLKSSKKINHKNEER